jgi:hypothetical protein
MSHNILLARQQQSKVTTSSPSPPTEGLTASSFLVSVEPTVVPTTSIHNRPSFSPSLSPPSLAPAMAMIPTVDDIPTVVLIEPPAPTGEDGPLSCNNGTHLCDRRVNEILFATVHNAASTAVDGFILPNHQGSIMEALQAGYRGINVDIGICRGNVIGLVHSSCFLGFGNLTTTFAEIASFLADNVNEVLIMPTQLDFGTGGEFTLSELAAIMPQSFRELLYEHHPKKKKNNNTNNENDNNNVTTTTATITPWPTLRELIASNQRILFFHYNGERCDDNDDDSSSSSLSTTTCPYGFMNWFDYAAESEYSFADIDSLLDKDQACRVTRGGEPSTSSASFYGVNVFTRFPNPDHCAILHSADFLWNHLTRCAAVAQRDNGVNVLLVDCWNVGDVVLVVHEYNQALLL